MKKNQKNQKKVGNGRKTRKTRKTRRYEDDPDWKFRGAKKNAFIPKMFVRQMGKFFNFNSFS